MTFDLQLLSIALLLGVAPITGSFLGTLVLRLPAGRAVLIDRSACDSCGHVLGFWDLVPLVNWAVSRGRCRFCGAGVSAFYPLIELAAVGIVLWTWTVAAGWQLWAGCVLGWLLLVLALTDAREAALPRPLLAVLAGLGVGAAALAAGGVPVASLAGVAAGGALGAAAMLADRRLGGRLGLCGEHALLLGASGLWVGWHGLPDVVVGALALAPLAGLAAARATGGDGRVPAGAGLCAATWLAWLYGPVLAG